MKTQEKVVSATLKSIQKSKTNYSSDPFELANSRGKRTSVRLNQKEKKNHMSA